MKDLREIWEVLHARQGGACGNCAKPMGCAEHSQIAHLVPQSRIAYYAKAHTKRYAERLIHDADNLKLVCSMECNHAVALPRYAWESHIQAIAKKLQSRR